MDSVLGVLVAALAVARATRLVTTDKITEPARVAAARRLRPGSALAYLLYCQWCASIWLALPAAVGLCLVYGWPAGWYLPLGLALSYTTGLLAQVERE